MQAITIAISPAGIQYFTEQLINQKALALLQGLKPPNKDISVSDFEQDINRYTKILIQLSSGSLQNFSPVYQKISQQPNQFVLTLAANNFSVLYAWNETYEWSQHRCVRPGVCWWTKPAQEKGEFQYPPFFGALTVNLILAFIYQASTKTYDIQVVSTTSSTANETANIPGGSIVHLQEDNGCFSTKVSDATSDAVSAIDFGTTINGIFPPLLDTIPASGQLTDNILYDFTLGDGGLTFPNNSGIAIGVTGNATYKGTPYNGATPPPLPLPPIPGDAHHLNVYISSYAVNALHWAFYSDGKLNVNLQPSNLPDPDVLKVQTYVSLIPAFKQYGNAVMYAAIAPKAASATSFQQVYEFATSVMNQLKSQLPSSVYTLLQGFGGEAFVSKTDLETQLTGTGIASSYFGTIEAAALTPGMVVTQTMEFALTIQNGASPQPDLIFNVARVDVMTNLGLGVSGAAQTMQFGFANVSNTATFISSTIPGFKGSDFGTLIWPVVGEAAYAEVMTDMGKAGVPIPIIQGFQFLFESVELTIQPGADAASGYVSILANVELKHQALPMQVQSILVFAE